MKKIFTLSAVMLLLTTICSSSLAFASEVPTTQKNIIQGITTPEYAIPAVPEVPAEQEEAPAEEGIAVEIQADGSAVVTEDAPVEEAGTHYYIGHFTITHYCICARCCGKSASNPAYGITATGTRATPQRTIAVDPRVIPYGTEVVINDHIYVAEDCGGAIKQKRIDVLVGSHSEALRKGVLRNVPVYVVM